MNDMNGSRVLLPNHEAETRQRAAQHAAAINTFRLQISAQIAGHLLPQQLCGAKKQAMAEQGLYDEDAAVTFDASEAIDQATSLAVATADALLKKLGLI